MSLFAIGDLHLSFGSSKPMDIFEGWTGYINKIENNWLNLINNNDTVVIPGDISWAMNLDEFKSDAEFLNRLPGKKMIIKGNHDYWWTTVSKMEAFLAENNFNNISIIHNNSQAAGNVCVCGTRGWIYDESEEADKKIILREAGRLEASLKGAQKIGFEPVVFLHFPPVYGNFECEEIMNVLINYKVRRCFYGHLHGNAKNRAFEGLYKDIIFRLISCDNINFTPIIVEKY